MLAEDFALMPEVFMFRIWPHCTGSFFCRW